MAILNKVYPLIIILLVAGCYEDFTPDVDTTPVLCLNSLITAGEPIEVSVTHTWLYTDDEACRSHRVNDAALYVYANGELQGEDYIPEEGDRIRIVAESLNYGKAEAEVTVPMSVPVEALEWEAYVRDVWEQDVPDWDMLADILFDVYAGMTIVDPADAVNYYYFSYSGFVNDEDGEQNPGGVPEGSPARLSTGTFREDMEPIFSEHSGTLDALSGIGSYGSTFFTDRQISGKGYKLHLQFDDMRYFVNSKKYDEDLLDCGLVLTISSVSESYYNWSNYKWQTNEGVLGDLSNVGLADPVRGYSNVSTGAGVVAARSCSICTVYLKDFLKDLLDSRR